MNLQHADSITGEVLTQDILWILGQVNLIDFQNNVLLIKDILLACHTRNTV